MATFHYYSQDNRLSYFVESEDMYHTVGSPLGCSFLGQFEGTLVEQYVYLPIYCRIEGGTEIQISGRSLLETYPLFATRGQFLWTAMQGDKIAFAEHMCQAEPPSGVSLRSYFLFASDSSGALQRLYDPCIGCYTDVTVILEDKSTELGFDVLCPVRQRERVTASELIASFDGSNALLNVLIDEFPKDKQHLSWANMESRGYVPLLSHLRDAHEEAITPAP